MIIQEWLLLIKSRAQILPCCVKRVFVNIKLPLCLFHFFPKAQWDPERLRSSLQDTHNRTTVARVAVISGAWNCLNRAGFSTNKLLVEGKHSDESCHLLLLGKLLCQEERYQSLATVPTASNHIPSSPALLPELFRWPTLTVTSQLKHFSYSIFWLKQIWDNGGAQLTYLKVQ